MNWSHPNFAVSMLIRFTTITNRHTTYDRRHPTCRCAKIWHVLHRVLPSKYHHLIFEAILHFLRTMMEAIASAKTILTHICSHVASASCADSAGVSMPDPPIIFPWEQKGAPISTNETRNVKSGDQVDLLVVFSRIRRRQASYNLDRRYCYTFTKKTHAELDTSPVCYSSILINLSPLLWWIFISTSNLVDLDISRPTRVTANKPHDSDYIGICGIGMDGGVSGKILHSVNRPTILFCWKRNDKHRRAMWSACDFWGYRYDTSHSYQW